MKEVWTNALDIQIGIFAHNILIFKHRLEEILDRYKVNNPEEIKRKIETKEIISHPAYEDYLDAIAYTLELKTLWERLEAYINNLKEITT